MRNAQTFLRLETPPLRVGMCPFANGNAAARTFGRAHRRRPYHFSYGSCHKIAGEVLAAAQTCVYSRGEVLAAAQKRVYSRGEVLTAAQKRVYSRGEVLAAAQT